MTPYQKTAAARRVRLRKKMIAVGTDPELAEAYEEARREAQYLRHLLDSVYDDCRAFNKELQRRRLTAGDAAGIAAEANAGPDA
jgi:hypothetical protein